MAVAEGVEGTVSVGVEVEVVEGGEGTVAAEEREMAEAEVAEMVV